MAKKIGIISDTHGLLRPEVLEILKTCDCILHAGDVDRPELLDRIRCLGSIYVVRGNNDRDWAEGIAKTLRFTIEGVKFFMTHNKKDVAWELGSAQVVIFGHTHSYSEKMVDGRLWLFQSMSLNILTILYIYVKEKCMLSVVFAYLCGFYIVFFQIMLR